MGATTESAIRERWQLLDFAEPDWSRTGRLLKRLIDVSFAFFGLLVLAIPFALVACLIKIDSRGPIFFSSQRVGRHGVLFTPLKFRTMVDGALSVGSKYQVSQADDRITRVGRILRNFSIDELPQLLNVLAGSMSLVGPRPSWPHEVLGFSGTQMGRLRVKPGVTGVAAVQGRNKVPWSRRLQIDNEYIDGWSLAVDLRVLLVTPWKVVSRDGIYGVDGINTPFTVNGDQAADLDDAARETVRPKS